MGGYPTAPVCLQTQTKFSQADCRLSPPAGSLTTPTLLRTLRSRLGDHSMRILVTARQVTVALGTFLVACGGESDPTDVQTPSEHRTPADSAAFLAQRRAPDTARMQRLEDLRRAALEASAALVPSDCDPTVTPGLEGEGGWISVCLGDTLTVTITSAECSGIGDVMYFQGVLFLRHGGRSGPIWRIQGLA